MERNNAYYYCFSNNNNNNSNGNNTINTKEIVPLQNYNRGKQYVITHNQYSTNIIKFNILFKTQLTYSYKILF